MNATHITWRDLRRLRSDTGRYRPGFADIEAQLEAFVRTLDGTVHGFSARCWTCPRPLAFNDGDVAVRRVVTEDDPQSGGCWHHLPTTTIDQLGAGRWREPILPTPPARAAAKANALGESRPKDTSEVSPGGGGDSDMHGGDGASGEVDDPQGPSTGSEDVTHAQDRPRGGVCGSARVERTSQDAPSDVPPPAAGATRREVRKDETGATPDDDAESDTPELAPGEAKPSDGRRRGKAPRPSGSGDASSPAAASTTRRSFGGVVVTPEEIQREMPLARLAAGQVVRAIRRLADDLGTLGDPTPKLDGSRLVRELAGKSYRLARARRAAAEPAVVAILVDVSGSCAGVANALLASAIEAARLDDRVAVVVHSNGLMVDGYRPIGRPLAGLTWQHDDTVGQLLAPLLSAGRIGRVIWAGDGDGIADLVMLAKASTRPLIWADSFGARSAPGAYQPPGAAAECAAQFGAPRTMKVWRGVNTANRMADAIVRSLEA